MQTRLVARAALYGAGLAAACGLAYAGWFRTPEADADTILSCAQAELAMGLWKEAQSKARQVLTSDPENLHALLVDAHCRTLAGDHCGARASYERALGSPNADADVQAEIRVALTLDALRRDDLAAARSVLECRWVLTNGETRAKVDHVAGLVFERRGEVDEAAARHVRVLEEPAAPLSLVLASARRLHDIGRGSAALGPLDRVLERLTEKVSIALVHYQLAKLKLDEGLADSARQHLCQLRGLPRGVLAADLAEDAEYWKTKIRTGELSAEFRDLVRSSEEEQDLEREPKQTNRGNPSNGSRTKKGVESR